MTFSFPYILKTIIIRYFIYYVRARKLKGKTFSYTLCLHMWHCEYGAFANLWYGISVTIALHIKYLFLITTLYENAQPTMTNVYHSLYIWVCVCVSGKRGMCRVWPCAISAILTLSRAMIERRKSWATRRKTFPFIRQVIMILFNCSHSAGVACLRKSVRILYACFAPEKEIN